MAAQMDSGAGASYAAAHSSLAVARGEQVGLKVEERAFSLFQPDILLPSQYLATTRRTFHLEPEQNLMLAVLEDAIICFQRNVAATHPKGRELFKEAEEWLLSTDSSWLYSFENICDALSFDPAYLREGLVRWKQQERSSRAGVKVVRMSSGSATPGNDKAA